MYCRLVITLAYITFVFAIAHAQAGSSAIQSSQVEQETQQPPQDELPPFVKNRKQHTEDWTTIYLAKSKLPLDATDGLVLNKVELPQGCTRELVRQQWRPNDPIDLYIIRPHSEDKLPVVLFLYNYTYDTDIFLADRWCERAKQNGFAVVGFGSALSWQRIHTPRPLKEWFVSELQEALATSTHDVQMVLNYLETLGDLDVHRVGIFGQGSGGAIAILAAAADTRISALDLMDPWGDWPDWLQGSKQIPEEERAAYLKLDFLQQVSNLDPVIYLPQMKGKTLRIQQVIADPVTPDPAKAKITSVASVTATVTRYPDITAEAKALGENGIVGWFGEQLNPRGLRNEAEGLPGRVPAHRECPGP